MKKLLTLTLVAAFALVGVVVAPKSAEAVPAFARQTGTECYGCHYQYMGPLNAFGRNFKLGGFTQTAQETVKGEGLDIPQNLNVGVMFGSTLTLGTAGGIAGNNNGNWNLANDASIFLGGRVGANMGTLVEWVKDGAENVKFVYSKDFGGVQGGVILYKTGAGPAFSMDLFNTGSNNMNFGLDNNRVFINQMAGPQSVGAQGLHFFAGSPMFFVNAGLFAPVGDNNGGNGYNAGLNFADYLRLAITPQVGGMDLMVGLQMTTGKATVNAGDKLSPASGGETKFPTSSTTIDAQAQFDIGGKQAQLIFAFGSIPGGTAAPLNAYNSGAKDISGMDLAFTMNLEKNAGVKLAYGSITNTSGPINTNNPGSVNGASSSGLGVGAWYDLAQNVHLSVEEFMLSSVAGTGAPTINSTSTTIEFRYLF